MDRVSSMLSFVKVVENGGFSAAGRQLTLATSIVTAHVKSLEERLGVRLLNRSTRSISLTEAGQSYYERCVQILSEIEEAEEAAQVLQARPRGTLRLNISPAVAVCIAPSITEFTSLYPDVSVRLTATTRMVNLVEEGFDLAIRFMAAADSNLILRRLASFRFVLCGSPDYLARRGRPEHPSDLVRHNCLIYYDAPFGKHGREWPFSGPSGDLTVRVSGSLEANSVGGLLAAARLGNGLIFAPSSTVAEGLKSGALVPLLTEFLPTEYSVDALYPHREHLPLKVRAFNRAPAIRCRGALTTRSTLPNSAVQRLMRALVVVGFNEVIELGLLLQEVFTGRLGGLQLQGQMHTLVPSVLLRIARFDALDRDAEPEPPDRKFGEVEEGIRTSKGNAIIGAMAFGILSPAADKELQKRLAAMCQKAT
jgi:DNA-binding transcriptional LysR family regulator